MFVVVLFRSSLLIVRIVMVNIFRKKAPFMVVMFHINSLSIIVIVIFGIVQLVVCGDQVQVVMEGLVGPCPQVQGKPIKEGNIGEPLVGT